VNHFFVWNRARAGDPPFSTPLSSPFADVHGTFFFLGSLSAVKSYSDAFSPLDFFVLVVTIPPRLFPSFFLHEGFCGPPGLRSPFPFNFHFTIVPRLVFSGILFFPSGLRQNLSHVILLPPVTGSAAVGQFFPAS